MSARIPIRKTRPALISLLLPILLLAGCGEPELTSIWADREIVIDGDHTDWEGAVRYFEDAGATIGIMNDATHLYLCLASTDLNIRRQVLGSGLTLWFEASDGEDDRAGIKFPIGAREMGMRLGEPGERPDPDAMMAWFEGLEPELEIVSSDGFNTRMFVAQAAGIEVDVGLTKGAFVYEAKIPLTDAGGAAAFIGAEAGSTIRLALETPEIDREMMRGRMGRGGPGGPGGRSGGGVRPGGGRGGMGGGMRGSGMRPDMPEPLDVSVRVTLAAGSVEP